jgi:hypothetical protein
LPFDDETLVVVGGISLVVSVEAAVDAATLVVVGSGMACVVLVVVVMVVTWLLLPFPLFPFPLLLLPFPLLLLPFPLLLLPLPLFPEFPGELWV